MIKQTQSFGIGIGLRRENSQELVRELPKSIACLEVAPENYMGTGGELFRDLKTLAQHYPILVHGLSLSLGTLSPWDQKFLKSVKKFLQEFKAPWMSDHLCLSSVQGHQVHDLLPLPYTQEAITYVAGRIRQLQDYFEIPFALENISCYTHMGEPEMSEVQFLRRVVEEADCQLLLDVNNIYVNSRNFGFDPYQYLLDLPLERVLQIHVAGHQVMEDFLLDTHGAEIIDPVWNLLGFVLSRSQPAAVIIERDHNIPPLSESLQEVKHAEKILRQAQTEPGLFSPHSSLGLKVGEGSR